LIALIVVCALAQHLESEESDEEVGLLQIGAMMIQSHNFLPVVEEYAAVVMAIAGSTVVAVTGIKEGLG